MAAAEAADRYAPSMRECVSVCVHSARPRHICYVCALSMGGREGRFPLTGFEFGTTRRDGSGYSSVRIELYFSGWLYRIVDRIGLTIENAGVWKLVIPYY